MIDPPQHVKYRRILDPLFAPKKMALLEDEVVALVKELVDEFAAKGSCDLHEEFAVPLPCRVFLRLMGLPLADLDIFLAVKDDIIRPPGVTMEEQAPHRKAAGQKVYEYFDAEVKKRRSHAPKDDLLGQIMEKEVDGIRLTDEEVLDICFLFIIAGLDTVTDSLDCFFAYLAQEPEQLRLLVEDETAIPSAVEELLRWESPVPAVPRVVTEDVEYEGCPVKAGEQVMLLIGSANTWPSGEACTAAWGRTWPGSSCGWRYGSSTVGSPTTGSSPERCSSTRRDFAPSPPCRSNSSRPADLEVCASGSTPTRARVTGAATHWRPRCSTPMTSATACCSSTRCPPGTRTRPGPASTTVPSTP
jgi:hypothetical protein